MCTTCVQCNVYIHAVYMMCGVMLCMLCVMQCLLCVVLCILCSLECVLCLEYSLHDRLFI